MKFKLLFVLIFILSMSGKSIAQEKDSVIILSDKVGSIITRDERDLYKLFPSIKNFNYSIVYKTETNKYYAKFCTTIEGELKDTMIYYSEQILLIIAEKINNFQDIVDGNYKMGTKPAILLTRGNESIIEDETRIRKIIPGIQKTTTSEGTILLSNSDDIVFSDSVELNKVKMKINRSFYKFGFGVSTYSPDMSGLNSAFTLIENFYRDQGYYILQHSTEFDFGVLLLYRINLIISEKFSLGFNAVQSTEGNNKLYSVAASGIYYYPLSNINWLTPFADFEISYNYCKARVNYNNRISPISNTGSYDFLDHIEASGSSTGFGLKVGASIDRGDNFSFDVFIKYNYIPKMKTVVTTGLLSADAESKLSSIVFGTMINLTY